MKGPLLESQESHKYTREISESAVTVKGKIAEGFLPNGELNGSKDQPALIWLSDGGEGQFDGKVYC